MLPFLSQKSSLPCSFVILSHQPDLNQNLVSNSFFFFSFWWVSSLEKRSHFSFAIKIKQCWLTCFFWINRSFIWAVAELAPGPHSITEKESQT